MKSTIYVIFMTIGLFVVLFTSGPCYSNSIQDSDSVAIKDVKYIALMEKLRARALDSVSTNSAYVFADYLIMLSSKGVIKRQSVSSKVFDEAIQCINQAMIAHPSDSSELLFIKKNISYAAGKSTLFFRIICRVLMVILIIAGEF